MAASSLASFAAFGERKDDRQGQVHICGGGPVIIENVLTWIEVRKSSQATVPVPIFPSCLRVGLEKYPVLLSRNSFLDRNP
jgi:hypothetical protein